LGRAKNVNEEGLGYCGTTEGSPLDIMSQKARWANWSWCLGWSADGTAGCGSPVAKCGGPEESARKVLRGSTHRLGAAIMTEHRGGHSLQSSAWIATRQQEKKMKMKEAEPKAASRSHITELDGGIGKLARRLLPEHGTH
jgi:hypothetical protein